MESVLITGGAVQKLLIGGNHQLNNMYKRNENGTFQQIRTVWDLNNFDDGYIDNKGRFRVWMPDNPRAYENGYIFRSVVAFEAYHGIPVPSDMNVHHLDANRLNDSKDNLVLMTHRAHSQLHNEGRKTDIKRTCQTCGETFLIKRWRLKDPSRGKYCSQKCYHEAPRTNKHKKAIKDGLKKAYREGRR